jgi:hypothetical protein
MSPYILNRGLAFGPSCPLGGQWFVCETGSNFVGCCNKDPCTLGCMQGSLEPASFDPLFYETFPDLKCESGEFYTCRDAKPPFMGCCKSNPCNEGCPTADLAGAFLGKNDATACRFYEDGCSSASSTQTASTVSSNPTISSTRTPSSSAAPVQLSTSYKSSTGPIVGAAVGGVAGIAIIVVLLFYCYRHGVKSRRAWHSGLEGRNNQRKVEDFTGTNQNHQSLPILFLLDFTLTWKLHADIKLDQYKPRIP